MIIKNFRKLNISDTYFLNLNVFLKARTIHVMQIYIRYDVI